MADVENPESTRAPDSAQAGLVPDQLTSSGAAALGSPTAEAAAVVPSSDAASIEAELSNPANAAGEGALTPGATVGPDAAKPKGKKPLAAMLGGLFSKFKSMRTQSAGSITDETVSEKISYLLQSVIASDRPTRSYGVLFWLSLVGLVMTVVIGIRYHNDEVAERERLARVLTPEKLAQIERDRILHEVSSLTERTLELGQFTVEVKAVGTAPRSKSNLNIAQVELVIECDEIKTCQWIKRNIEPARDEIVKVFSPFDREDILSRDGKRRLQRAILDRLNSFLHDGKVTKLNFYNLTIT